MSTPGAGHSLSGEMQKVIHMYRILCPTTKLIDSLTIMMEPGLQMPAYNYIGLSKLRLGMDMGAYGELIPTTLIKLVDLGTQQNIANLTNTYITPETLFYSFSETPFVKKRQCFTHKKIAPNSDRVYQMGVPSPSPGPHSTYRMKSHPNKA